MTIEFSPYEQRLNFQEMRDSLEARCQNFWPDQVASLAHVLAYNLRRAICAPDQPCGQIMLLKDATSLGLLIDLDLKPRKPAGNSEIEVYYSNGNNMAASDIFIPGRVLVTPRDIMSENIVGDETADKTDMPLLIESTREGTIYGLAPSITTYATNSLFRKNYLSAMRKRNKERNDTSDPTARHSEFHTTLKFLKDEMAKRHGTGGPTNVPDLHKVPLPIEKKAIALAPVIATACSDSGPLILHRGTKRYGRLLGAEYQSERLSLIYNTANDHERRCDLAKESFLPMAAYWRIPENNDGSIIIVGRQDTNKVQYVIAPTKGSISKYRAARERLLQDVSSICMDTSD